MARPRSVLALLLALPVVAAGLGCARRAGGTDKLQVVATVAPLTNLVANIAGPAASVVGLVPEGIDSHTFEPAPSDARYLATADVVFVNGLNLEQSIIELARANVQPEVPVVALAERVRPDEGYIFDDSFPRSQGDPNPHLWTNPLYALRFCEVIAAELTRADPSSAAVFRANLAAMTARLRAMDRAVRAVTRTIPAKDRRLLTFHDSWPYFAREYGWSVIGAIQPADFSEPTPRELAEIIGQIEAEDIPVVFGSEVFPSPVLERIEAETGARYVDDLRDDDLPGEPGDPEHSYLGLMVLDFEILMGALGGEVAPLRRIDIANLPGTSATDYRS